MKLDNNQQAFFALLRAGLWEKEVRLLPYGVVDFAELLCLAEGQSVVGIVAAGIEHVTDTKLQKKDVLQFIGRTVQMEQRNSSMNCFIGFLIEELQKQGISAILVKGQGIAMCYERPQWRSSGDVDLLFDAEQYEMAKTVLVPLSTSSEREDKERKHLGLTINPWVVELHGSLRGYLSRQIDKVIDCVQEDTITNKRVRFWDNESTRVLLPDPDNDVIFVFAHILQHFFKGGIGLRQICDWIRLLYTYRGQIDRPLLSTRLLQMGVLTEWKAFSALAVYELGMPSEAMPLFEPSPRYKRKSRLVLDYILDAGNFGNNRDKSYIHKRPVFLRRTISLFRQTCDSLRLIMIFPVDAVRFWCSFVLRRTAA